MAGREPRLRVVRRGAAAGRLFGGADAHLGDGRDRLHDVHAAPRHVGGGAAVSRRNLGGSRGGTGDGPRSLAYSRGRAGAPRRGGTAARTRGAGARTAAVAP